MKINAIYSCQSCGYQSPKWLGRCPDCSAWSSLVQENYIQPASSLRSSIARADSSAAAQPVLLKELRPQEDIRVKTGIQELDRVLGGGLVKGAVTLLGGGPGIGKSTISLQLSYRIAALGLKVLYISAEESVQQTLLRAQRLGAANSDGIYIVNQTELSLILEYVDKIKPDVFFIDSIQVIFNSDIPSGPGSVSQVRECAYILTQTAKINGISLFIIGHVTKEGTIAGPRVLEHIVDTVLYFEGEKNYAFRILRAIKNRFGSTNEIGVFQMGQSGLEAVDNPSKVFLAERPEKSSGSSVTCVIEGTRPMLLEIQALVWRSSFGYPSRRCEGFDVNRLNMIIAILEKRLGMHLENEDVFVNVVGGVKIDDSSCDLAVAAAIASNLKDKIVDRQAVLIGETGLAGEIRSVYQIDSRIQESIRLGFKKCIIPKGNLEKQTKLDIELIAVRNINEALDAVLS